MLNALVDGRYRLRERIGSGGAASVYRAEDLRLERAVALKVLHPGLAEEEELVRRFRREARCAACLFHPNVVSVYDSGAWSDTHYIAMEYVPGRSLKSIIRDEGPLEPRRAIGLVVQVLRAAAAIHTRGIVHRDLKPHNAIVDGADQLKVTDFGIARAAASELTVTGEVFGSVHYLSPEQAEGGEVSAASDLYSIGVILYESLAGRLPFQGETAVTVALKHLRERPAPLRALNPAVTPQLESAVMRALEKDPARRFEDADSFIASLAEATVGAAAEVHRVGAHRSQRMAASPRFAMT